MDEPTRPEPVTPAPVCCVVCGRELGGLSEHDVCPGCGQPAGVSMSRAARDTAGAPLADGEDGVIKGVECVRCKHVNRAILLTQHCSGCGMHIAFSLPEAQRALIPADRLPCRACGYDLSGLKFGDVCPECGTDVASSHLPPSLETSPREPVMRVSRGLAMVFWLVIVGIFVSPFAAVFSGFRAGAGMSPVSILLPTLLSGVMFYAWLLVTTPIPRMPNPGGNRTLRLWILWLMGVGLASSLLSVIAGVMMSGSVAGGGAGGLNGPATVLFVLSSLLGIVNMLVAVAILFLKLVYLRRIARFTPSPLLERRYTLLIKTAIWGMAGGVALWVVSMIVVAVSLAAGGLFALLGVLPMFAIGIGALAWYVYYIASILRLSRAVKKATRAIDLRLQREASV